MQKFYLPAACSCLLWLLVGCPRSEPWPPPAKVGVCRAEHQFPMLGQAEVSIKAVIFYPDLGASKPIYHCPLIIVNPGYSDTSTGLDYLGEALAGAGFYVVSYDPPDGMDFLPQGGSTNVQIDWPILSARLMVLHDALLAAGYQVPGATPTSMLEVIKQCLKGQLSNQNELDICKRFFDYRLNSAQSIIEACQTSAYELPGGDLVDTTWVGTIGYSLGGLTALQLSGADNCLPQPMVKATLLLAPVMGLFTPKDVSSIVDPLTCLEAGQDEATINVPIKALWPFCPEPKTLVEYPDFGHLDFTQTFDYLLHNSGAGDAGRAEVATTAVKFFLTEKRRNVE